MNRPNEPTAVEQFGAACREDRYRNGEGPSRHDSSPSLVAEVGGLAQVQAGQVVSGLPEDQWDVAVHARRRDVARA